VAIVEYFSLPGRLVIFVVERGRVTAVQEPSDRATLERDCARFGSALANAEAEAPALGRRLHDRLIAPVVPLLAGKQTLVIVAGPPLASTPFAALSDGSGEYLVQHYSIVIAPSAAVYARLGSRKPGPGARHLLVLSNPAVEGRERLPDAQREAEKAATAYESVTPLTGEGATAAAFREAAPAADVIHLATHGVVPEDARGHAAPLLADGRLDVPAIASMHLTRTAVVVVAACSSARGPVRPEGTISVARAFLAAGVPSVIATLWDVGDRDSAEFFPRLHSYLAQGLAPAEALRATQMDAIQRREPPALWAAVQVIGK